MNWIAIESEKPNPVHQILVLMDGSIASVVKYNGKDFTEDGLEVEDVTHWMYIPESPISRNTP